MNKEALILALFIAFLWGMSPIIHKVALHKISPPTALVISSIFYMSCVVVYAMIYKDTIIKDVHALDVRIMCMLAFTSIVCGFLSNIIYFGIIKKYESHIVSALIYACPIFTLIFASLFLRERISRFGVIGVVLITLGVICLAFNKAGNEPFASVMTV